MPAGQWSSSRNVSRPPVSNQTSLGFSLLFAPEVFVARWSMLEAVHLTKRYASLPRCRICRSRCGPDKSSDVSAERIRQEHNGEDAHRMLLQPHAAWCNSTVTTFRKPCGLLEAARADVRKNRNLYPYLTGWEYLELIGTLRGMEQRDLETRINSRLEMGFPASAAARRHGFLLEGNAAARSADCRDHGQS